MNAVLSLQHERSSPSVGWLKTMAVDYPQIAMNMNVYARKKQLPQS